jgi:hypothetical protein
MRRGVAAAVRAFGAARGARVKLSAVRGGGAVRGTRSARGGFTVQSKAKNAKAAAARNARSGGRGSFGGKGAFAGQGRGWRRLVKGRRG